MINEKIKEVSKTTQSKKPSDLKLNKIYDREYFLISAEDLAKNLIGKIICRIINDENLFFKIVETEAYQAPEDKACHAYKGKTNKTKYFWSIG